MKDASLGHPSWLPTCFQIVEREAPWEENGALWGKGKYILEIGKAAASRGGRFPQEVERRCLKEEGCVCVVVLFYISVSEFFFVYLSAGKPIMHG